jgi:hypothetical protein
MPLMNELETNAWIAIIFMAFIIITALLAFPIIEKTYLRPDPIIGTWKGTLLFDNENLVESVFIFNGDGSCNITLNRLDLESVKETALQDMPVMFDNVRWEKNNFDHDLIIGIYKVRLRYDEGNDRIIFPDITYPGYKMMFFGKLHRT